MYHADQMFHPSPHQGTVLNSNSQRQPSLSFAATMGATDQTYRTAPS